MDRVWEGTLERLGSSALDKLRDVRLAGGVRGTATGLGLARLAVLSRPRSGAGAGSSSGRQVVAAGHVGTRVVGAVARNIGSGARGGVAGAGDAARTRETSSASAQASRAASETRRGSLAGHSPGTAIADDVAAGKGAVSGRASVVLIKSVVDVM